MLIFQIPTECESESWRYLSFNSHSLIMCSLLIVICLLYPYLEKKTHNSFAPWSHAIRLQTVHVHTSKEELVDFFHSLQNSIFLHTVIVPHIARCKGVGFYGNSHDKLCTDLHSYNYELCCPPSDSRVMWFTWGVGSKGNDLPSDVGALIAYVAKIVLVH